MISLNLISLKPLDNNSSKISRSEWNAIIDWYFVVIQSSQESKIASLQNKILRLIEANKGLKKYKMAPTASGSSLAFGVRLLLFYLFSPSFFPHPPAPPGQTPPWELSYLPPSLLHCLCFLYPHSKVLAELPLFSETLPTPFSSELVLKKKKYCPFRTSLEAQMVEHLSTMWETRVRSLGQEDHLEKEMATHSSILAWRIPWMEEPGGLQSMGSQRVGHD